MKKLRLFFTLALVSLVACLCLCSCGDDKEVYTVTLKSELNPYSVDGKITAADYLKYDGIYKTVEVEEGKIVGDVELVVSPAAKYRFCGWFTDTSFAIQWNTAQDVVKGNMTLYAKWEKIS